MLRAIPIVAALLVAAPASATEFRTYDQRAFVAAQAADRPILVEVHAPWCPICAAQGKALKKFTANAGYKDLIVFRIDFDSQKPIWSKFGAKSQSTLIAYHGRKETGRIAYDSNEQHISALLASTKT
jgi:thioredoxin 1